ncbi:MAG: phospholipid-binding lipoprotein MlaA [Rhodothermales bacterium]|jgi:phospholipid-binding lipoprotein MlaA
MQTALIGTLVAAILCIGAHAQEATELSANDLYAEFGGSQQWLSSESSEPKDPLQPVNRFMFGVNDKLYFWLLKPLGVGWSKVAPQPAREGMRNFFGNLRTPVRTVNALLQGNGGKAGEELRRFGINTTIGLLGVRDAAKKRGVPAPSPEDLGQSLAVYRVGAGWYIVWPIFGPSNIRDSIGMFGDRMLDPVTYTGDASFPIGLSETINRTSLQIGRYEKMKSDALDPYTFMRDVFQQRRAKLIKE